MNGKSSTAAKRKHEYKSTNRNKNLLQTVGDETMHSASSQCKLIIKMMMIMTHWIWIYIWHYQVCRFSLSIWFVCLLVFLYKKTIYFGFCFETVLKLIAVLLYSCWLVCTLYWRSLGWHCWFIIDHLLFAFKYH